jgi:hypothetical protein
MIRFALLVRMEHLELLQRKEQKALCRLRRGVGGLGLNTSFNFDR